MGITQIHLCLLQYILWNNMCFLKTNVLFTRWIKCVMDYSELKSCKQIGRFSLPMVQGSVHFASQVDTTQWIRNIEHILEAVLNCAYFSMLKCRHCAIHSITTDYVFRFVNSGVKKKNGSLFAIHFAVTMSCGPSSSSAKLALSLCWII